ncbi:glycosyl hydrolase family 28 protein [Asticcacaulis sp. ZE23SCel15]|uniref:glycoside hydrolase family 28 protein n=1 Tax=Asticcacaulis sp. ZE23SCel15 TaxID=3059027 RepID=UPI00265E593F|nr:glycosyl hydrolase family 28 protein [Asticcacaulis sp. ZE23SCel15]WKL57624.1 glycosyl hydrolase family 28 protein [Asticcacaulis sp. ZE23SCel15]
MTQVSRRRFGAGAAAMAGAVSLPGLSHAAACAMPDWALKLRADLEKMATDLTARLKPWSGPNLVATPEDHGYTGGLATKAIQAAIDDVARRGGGTVRLSKGDYVSGTIDLKSNIRFEVAKGARLLGSLDLNDYPERIAKRLTVQDTNMGMHQSLIFGQGLTNISICGHGEIDGRGSKENFPGLETIHGTPGRPFVIRIIDCQRVHIRDISLKDSPCWMQNYLNCDDLLIEHIKVENQVNFNNDGLDIDGCRHVIVRHCYISSGDDAMCFKGAAQSPGENILVEYCTFFTSCNAVKLGTDSQSLFRNVFVRHCLIGGVSEDMRRVKVVGADSGVAWKMVDGGTAENLLISDIKIIRARSPIFMRLEKRGRVKPGDPPAPIGTLRRVVFERITGEDNGPRGSYFIGIPEKSIEDVVIRDFKVSQNPSTKPVLAETAIGEMYGEYPDPHMIDGIGDAPAYGLWARHIKGLTLIDYKVTPTGTDPRPEYVIKTNISGVCGI